MSSEAEAAPVVVEYRGGIAVFSFPSRAFQKKEAEYFSFLLDQLQKQGIHDYIVDLTECDYVSSEGLGATARCWKWCHDQKNGSMAVVLSSSSGNEVRNLFEIIGLSHMIGSAIQPTLDDAIIYVKNFS